jgi:hypothetical protein
MKWSEVHNILQSDLALDQYKKCWAFVAFEFVHSDEQDVIEWYLFKEMASANLLNFCEQNYPIETVQSNENRLTFCFSDSDRAVLFAFDVLPKLGSNIRVGLGYGIGYFFDTFQSIHLLNTYSILSESTPNELVCTEAFFNNVSLPDGVGSFPANNIQCQRSGRLLYILKDYRGDK